MGRTFQDDLQSDANNTFLNLREFAEAGTYYAKTGPGAWNPSPTAFLKDEEVGGPTDEAHIRVNQRVALFTLPESLIAWPSDEDYLEMTERGQVVTWSFHKIVKRETGFWCLKMTTAKNLRDGFSKPNGQ
jgi:hypothetical protein